MIEGTSLKFVELHMLEARVSSFYTKTSEEPAKNKASGCPEAKILVFYVNVSVVD